MAANRQASDAQGAMERQLEAKSKEILEHKALLDKLREEMTIQNKALADKQRDESN